MNKPLLIFLELYAHFLRPTSESLIKINQIMEDLTNEQKY